MGTANETPQDKSPFENTFQAFLIHELQRIASAMDRFATAQENLVIMAAEAREERMKTARAMVDRLKAGFPQEPVK